MSSAEALQAVTNGYRLPNPEDNHHIVCPADLYEIMTDCWHSRPEDRPSFSHLSDSFVQLRASLMDDVTDGAD